jgi:hypothetical protein
MPTPPVVKHATLSGSPREATVVVGALAMRHACGIDVSTATNEKGRTGRMQ